jgi:2-polyprenyl-3-methyl-5-hydroxy-6-metoxy-1,4-benzoquinol methylase
MKNFIISRNRISILPITNDEISQIINLQYSDVFKLPKSAYKIDRGIKELLLSDSDYARLPGYFQKSALQIIQELPTQSKMMDIGTGSGKFLKEVKRQINSNIETSGFDAINRATDKSICIYNGNIDDLSISILQNELNTFSLVTSASLLYHVPDYLGAILRISKLIKKNGYMLLSTIPRVVLSYFNSKHKIIFDDSVDNNKGELLYRENNSMLYFRNRNVFNIKGRIVSIQELVNLINKFNKCFHLEYSVCKSKTQGARWHGGQFACKKISESSGLNLNFIFYCKYIIENDPYLALSYIVAKNKEETKILRNAGFISLSNRFNQSINTQNIKKKS